MVTGRYAEAFPYNGEDEKPRAAHYPLERLDYRGAGRLAEGCGELICLLRSRWMAPQRVVKGLRCVCEGAGISDSRIHDLRPTCASHLIM